jgi:hypothetical protein
MDYRDGFVYFFESVEMPNHYIIMEHGEDGGEDWYNRFNRLGRFDETENKKNGTRFGYPEVKVKKPVSVAITEEEGRWRFHSYVIDTKVVKYVEAKESMGSWGWYFIEKLQIQKWLEEFYSIESKKQKETIERESNGKQMPMF